MRGAWWRCCWRWSLGLALSLLLFAVRRWVPLIFMAPSEGRVIERTQAIMPWLIGCETGFGVSTVLSGQHHPCTHSPPSPPPAPVYQRSNPIP